MVTKKKQTPATSGYFSVKFVPAKSGRIAAAKEVLPKRSGQFSTIEVFAAPYKPKHLSPSKIRKIAAEMSLA